jgi:hypothetical protein
MVSVAKLTIPEARADCLEAGATILEICGTVAILAGTRTFRAVWSLSYNCKLVMREVGSPAPCK